MLLVVSAICNIAMTQESIINSSGSAKPILVPGTDDVTWTTVGTAPTIFGRSGGGIIGNYMYSFGSEAVNCAQAYNLATQQWEASTLVPFGRDNWASATTDDAVYLIGGFDGASFINRTQRFVPFGIGPEGTWTQMASYPHAVSGPTAAWDGGDNIYACGGIGFGYLLTAYKYSISGNTWTAIADLPVAMAFSGSAFIDGKFYVFGGSDAAGLGTRHYCYDPTTDTWTQKASALTPVWLATFSTTFNDTYMISCGGGGGYGAWPATNAVQIYNPATDSWSEETSLPDAWGCNLARWATNGTVISSGGYQSTSGYTGVTYEGTDFFGPTIDITIELTPSSPPIVIPAGGGSFEYTIAVTNNETTSQSFQVWVIITLPGGQSYGPVIGPVTATIGGSTTVSRLRTQNVPAFAPAGSYSCVGSVGTYPTVWNSSNFPFTKSDTDNGFTKYDSWASTGESFGDQISTAFAAPDGYSLEAAYPNPFNPETNLMYKLAKAGNVKLAVYDIQGCEVALLLDGYHSEGSYMVSFSGANLSSGIYIAMLNAGGNTFTQKLLLVK
jgi:hypothetical protein